MSHISLSLSNPEFELNIILWLRICRPLHPHPHELSWPVMKMPLPFTKNTMLTSKSQVPLLLIRIKEVNRRQSLKCKA